MLGKLWEFRFFNYDEGSLSRDAKLDEVIARVLADLAVSNAVEGLKLLANKGVRRKIRGYYKQLAHDHNDLSVMLWHGPQPSRGLRWAEVRGDWQTAGHFRIEDLWSVPVGTLLTGDIRLSLKFQAITKHFLSKWLRTSEVQAPHHGSKHSWYRDITRAVPKGSEFVIGAGVGDRYGHPHRSVIVDILRFHGCRYVTECRGLERRMWFHP